MALVKSYATSTLLLWVVHHYFLLNHAISSWLDLACEPTLSFQPVLKLFPIGVI